MKRTTYIMMGMLLAGLLAVAGTLFYLSTVSVDATNRFVEIGGERKTVQLPACRVVHMMYADVRKDAPIYDFSNLLLDIAPADTAAGSLSYRSGLDRFLTMETVADTLRLVFRQPDEQADVYDEPYRWLSKQSGNMQMALPETVQEVVADYYAMPVIFKGFRRDSLSVNVGQGMAVLEDCQLNSLFAVGSSLHFKSGAVKNLHLDLDRVRNWQVDAWAFDIDTEYLTGTSPSCNLAKGECRRLVWLPKTDSSILDIRLNEPAEIVVKE